MANFLDKLFAHVNYKQVLFDNFYTFHEGEFIDKLQFSDAARFSRQLFLQRRNFYSCVEWDSCRPTNVL